MSFNVLLTSPNYNSQNGKMLFNFPSSVQLSGKEVALISATFYNCFFNVSQALGNNTITITRPHWVLSGGLTVFTDNISETLTFADGFYSIPDLNQAIQNFCISKGFYLYNPATGQNVYFISIETNSTSYQCEIDTYFVPTATQSTANGFTNPSGLLLTNGTAAYAPSITIGNLATILGIVPGSYWGSLPSHTGSWTNSPAASVVSNVAPEVNPVTSICVRCNLVNSQYSSPNDLIAQVPVTAAFGSVNDFVAPYPTFTPTVTSLYSGVEVSFMDQNLLPLKFFDPDITLSLQLRDIK
jgi:hypothetical protein